MAHVRSMVCALAAGVSAAVLAGVAGAQTPWSLVLLPDTQFYSDNAGRFPQFLDQTNWIEQNRARLSIAFVSHLGDIVQNGANGGNNVEWDRADQAMDVLDGIGDVLPYSASIGNHDYNTVSSKASGSNSYNFYFGPARYAGQPWYLGASSNNQNHAQIFSAGGRSYLHLNLEWQPNAAAFAWAQGVIDANPGLPVLLSTHEHIIDADSGGNGAGRSAAGTNTWNSFVRTNPRILFTFNGHFHQGTNGLDGEFYLDSLNNSSLQVLEMLSDYQDWTNGGSGYLRVLRFDERHSMVRVRTFTPTLDRYEVDVNSRMNFAYDFAARMDGSAPTISAKTFREGENAYVGTQDTTVNSATPGTANGAATSLSVDSLDGSPAGPNHGLVRFDNIFGAGFGQIAADSDVLVAKLRVRVTNPGSGFTVHRMLIDWTEASTWTSLVSGVAADGIEALAAADSIVGANVTTAPVPVSTLDIDVTPMVRAWMNGEANRGLALLPYASGSNGVDFDSSESATVANRPALLVWTPTEPVTLKTIREGLDGYAGTQDVELRQVDPALNTGANVSITLDSDEPNGSGNDTQALVRFDGLFGPGGAIPANSKVTSAVLVLRVFDEGSGFTVHRALTSWDESATWNSTAAGISADDAEASIEVEASAGANTGTGVTRVGPHYFDVTETVQAWNNGEANQGWVLRPFASGTNGVDFATSENADPSQRPTLIVRYIAPAAPPFCPGDADASGTVNFSDITSVLGNLGTSYGAGNTGPGDADGDGAVNFSDITAVLANLGSVCS